MYFSDFFFECVGTHFFNNVFAFITSAYYANIRIAGALIKFNTPITAQHARTHAARAPNQNTTINHHNYHLPTVPLCCWNRVHTYWVGSSSGSGNGTLLLLLTKC